MKNSPTKIAPFTAWAVIDLQKPIERWTYNGDGGKTIGLYAIYDKKPKIPKEWRDAKKAIRVRIEAL